MSSCPRAVARLTDALVTYVLTLKGRAGRWEIASLDGALVPAAAANLAARISTPPSTPSTTSGPTSAGRIDTATTLRSQL